jgi:hypothetical protein
MVIKITAKISSGLYRGEILYPHRMKIGPFKGKFIVTPDRFQKNYIPVNTVEELVNYIQEGLSLRMSTKEKTSATLIIPENIQIVEESESLIGNEDQRLNSNSEAEESKKNLLESYSKMKKEVDEKSD